MVVLSLKLFIMFGSVYCFIVDCQLSEIFFWFWEGGIQMGFCLVCVFEGFKFQFKFWFEYGLCREIYGFFQIGKFMGFFFVMLY